MQLRFNDRLPDVQALNNAYRLQSSRSHGRHNLPEASRFARVSDALDEYIEEARFRGRSWETVRHMVLACFLSAAPHQ